MLSMLLAMLETEEDRERFLKLHGTYEKKLYAVAVRVLGDRTAAEDAVQQTWLQLIRRWDRVSGLAWSETEGYLVTAVKNVAVDMLRKERREEALPEDWDPPAPETGETDYRYLVSLIRALPESYRREMLRDSVYYEKNVQLSDIYEDKRFLAGQAIVNDTTGDLVGFVVVTAPMNQTTDYMLRSSTFFLYTAITALGLALVAATFLSRSLVRPLGQMADVARRFGYGETKLRAEQSGKNTQEVNDLALAFNTMADSLEQSEQRRQEFIANVSHDFRSPLTSIKGYLEAILDGTIPPENERQYLQIISDESRRLSRLVRRMLDVSQLQAIDPLREGKHFDICESMRRVLISMERKITDRNLDVEADIPEEPILVLGDKDMITQVIYNLLENATKFAREGSTLYLGVTTIDGKARVTVRNEGDTIPAEELPLLFERFHKSDKSRSEDKDGYGLGLYIVKTILEQHKEKISVTSEDGVTAFSFSLATE